MKMLLQNHFIDEVITMPLVIIFITIMNTLLRDQCTFDRDSNNYR